MVIFHPCAQKPPVDGYAPNRGRRRNHLWQIFRWSVEGYRFCGGSNIALSHWQSQSLLTQSWCYRAACNATLRVKLIIIMIHQFITCQFRGYWTKLGLERIPNNWVLYSSDISELMKFYCIKTLCAWCMDAGCGLVDIHWPIFVNYCLQFVHEMYSGYPQYGVNPEYPGYPAQPGFPQPGFPQPQAGYPTQPGPVLGGYPPQPSYPAQPGYGYSPPGGYPPQPGYAGYGPPPPTGYPLSGNEIC